MGNETEDHSMHGLKTEGAEHSEQSLQGVQGPPGVQRRRAITAGALMLGAAALARWATPERRWADEQPFPRLSMALPETFGEWTSKGQNPAWLVSPDVQSALDAVYQQTLTRTYVAPALRDAAPVMLAAAYGGDQSDATRAHRPEVCYPAQGFKVGRGEKSMLELERGVKLPVRRLVAVMGARHEPVTYWITVGEQATTSGMEQKLAQLRYGLRGLVPDGLLMRISTIDRDEPRAWAQQERFLRELYRAVEAGLRSRLFGVGDLQDPMRPFEERPSPMERGDAPGETL